MGKLFTLLFFFLSLLPLAADSSGILKTRLIEKEDGTLILECDAPAIQEGSLGTPVFPARYRLADFSRSESLDLLTLSYTARPYGGGFSSRDVIELPWAVNGISLTVLRSDGSTSRSLHKRGLTGISIPLERVLPQSPTLREELRRWMVRLLRSPLIFLPLLLLALLMGTLSPPEKLPLFWSAWFGSHAAALPLAEAGLTAPLLLFSQILTLFLILYLALQCSEYGEESSCPGLLPLLAAGGFITGVLSYGEYSLYALSGEETAGYYVLTLLISSSAALLVSFAVSLLRYFSGDPPMLRKVLIYLPSTGAFFLILLLFSARVQTGETALLGEDTKVRGESGDGAAIVLSQNSGTVLAYPEAPLSLFVAVDPYELRLEVLIHLSALIPEEGSLSPGEQPDFLDSLEQELLGKVSVEADDRRVDPVRREASFVQKMNNGIALRSQAVREEGKEGLVGITLIYGCDERIGSIRLDWNYFPSGIADFPVRLAAPWENRAYVLSRKKNVMNWERLIPAEQKPAVLPLAGMTLPVLSLVLFFAGLGIVVFGRGRATVFLPVLLVLALVLYPHPRISVPGPLRLSAGSSENLVLILDGLLGNLYRSFELKDDEMVYDRLSLSVEGEFLQEVFLQNRRAMVLEERGGARARVEDVTMISSDFAGSSDKGGILVRAEWTVSGAVSHFGHTHYRRNRYSGDISLSRSGTSWKISDIVLKDEEREL